MEANFELTKEVKLYNKIDAQQNSSNEDSGHRKEIKDLSFIQTEVDLIKKVVNYYYDFSMNSYIPIEFSNGLRKSLSIYNPLTGQLSFDKIENLAK